MNQIANVVFAYSPKNDDELELTVGDKIEVIGYEEEGWWKGRLKGRTGVFPSNFVQVIESGATTQNPNKINSLFGSVVNTKNSLSSNSLNNISTNNSNLNNNNSTSNNNLVMNNTQQHQQQQELVSSSDCNIASTNEDQSVFHSTNNNSTMNSERRPKPLRGIGYGDIFAAGAKTRPLPADPPITSSAKTTAMASERLSTASLASTLQKPIPKKPPPPAPADVSSTNGSPPDQAPALPPKPSNQFNPFIQQNQRQLPPITQQQRTVIEKVQVVYAYKPSNSDELEMDVGDIIDVLDKNIEDQGWWRGELKGKIGVFPDNFVQPLEATQQQQEVPAVRSWQISSRLSSSATSNQSNNTSSSEGHVSQQPTIGSSESGLSGRIKSVFAGTPKGFSKELESNLERHSNPGSFLSLKRNELQQQSSSGLATDVMSSSPKSNSDNMSAPTFNTVSATLNPNNHQTLTSTMTSNGSPPRQNGYTNNSTNPLNSTSPGKLNHITATRAKGPARRPPKNILNKRNQLNESSSSNESTKRELPKLKDEITSAASLISFNQATSSTSPTTASLPQNVAYPEVLSTIPGANDQQHSIPTQVKNKLTPPVVQATTPTTTNTTPPPWMVELRKTNAEKKRDPLPVATMNALVGGSGSHSTEESITQSSVPSTPITSVTTPPMVDAALLSKSTPVTPTILPSLTPNVSAVAPQLTSLAPPSQEPGDNNHGTSQPAPITTTKHDGILKQISNNVTKEINELKLEVKKLRQDFKGMEELKLALEAMKVELKACQSATESQRKYIKDLVNNLADERKKIASMQVEIDRNLK